MSVLEAVAAKARALSSGFVETDSDDESSRVSARERLQLLGIGGGTLTRFPVQSLPESRASANSPLKTSDSGIDNPDISERSIDLQPMSGSANSKSVKTKVRTSGTKKKSDNIKDKTGRWKSDLRTMYSYDQSDTTGLAEAHLNINQEVDAPTAPNAIPSTQQPTLAAKRRRVAAKQLKQFHVFSLSLVAVLVSSVWMFGYVMLS